MNVKKIWHIWWNRVPYSVKGLVITTSFLACVAGSAGTTSGAAMILIVALAIGVGHVVYDSLKHD